MDSQQAKAAELQIALERDGFLRNLLRELTGTLQDVVGVEEASGFVSIVGHRVGEQLHKAYCDAWETEQMDLDQLAEALVDLKRRIEGDFYVIEKSEEKIVFGNRKCPFEEKVLDRPSLCMMTSNVFGSMAALSMGYAKVHLQETIAAGDGRCKVTLYLKQNPESEAVPGREYFG